MKHRHLHKRFLVPNARRGTDPKILGYADVPARPVAKATGVDRGGRDIAADSLETIRRIAAATAMCDEPECDSEDVATYAESAFTAHSLRHQLEVQTAQEVRKTLPVEIRLLNVIERAKAQRVDVAQDVFILRKQIERAAKGRRKVPTITLVRLEKVEARLDGVTDLPRAA